MDNKLIQIQNTQQLPTVLSSNELAFAKAVYHVNQLTSFQLTATQIEDWSRSLADLFPKLQPQVLKEVIDQMKLGLVEYDQRLGIQNLCLALREFGEPDKDTIRVRKAMWEEENQKNLNRTPDFF